jgi:hypothetical protein
MTANSADGRKCDGWGWAKGEGTMLEFQRARRKGDGSGPHDGEEEGADGGLLVEGKLEGKPDTVPSRA